MTSPRSSSPPESQQPIRPLRALGHGIWVLIPLLSIGFLPWVAAVQAAWKARTAGWIIVATLLSLSGALTMVGMATDMDNSTLLGMNLIAGAIGGVAAGIQARRVVFESQEPRLDPAVAAVLDQRAARERAREIVAEDPAMARSLGIGRPELARDYDDGGLVDLNHATAHALVTSLGWPTAAAHSFVAEREARHGFVSLAEVSALSSVDPRLLDRSADAVVLLPYAFS